MAISLSQMRAELLPGLRLVAGGYERLAGWERVFAPSIQAPHIWVPKLTLPGAMAVGAAVAIIRNPTVTRRFWSGWTSDRVE